MQPTLRAADTPTCKKKDTTGVVSLIDFETVVAGGSLELPQG